MANYSLPSGYRPCGFCFRNANGASYTSLTARFAQNDTKLFITIGTATATTYTGTLTVMFKKV
jgi:hypothetical protein